MSVEICERRSRLSGSTVWYSSSIPRVNEGRIDQGPFRSLCVLRGESVLSALPQNSHAHPFFVPVFLARDLAGSFDDLLRGCLFHQRASRRRSRAGLLWPRIRRASRQKLGPVQLRTL